MLVALCIYDICITFISTAQLLLGRHLPKLLSTLRLPVELVRPIF